VRVSLWFFGSFLPDQGEVTDGIRKKSLTVAAVGLFLLRYSSLEVWVMGHLQGPIA